MTTLNERRPSGTTGWIKLLLIQDDLMALMGALVVSQALVATFKGGLVQKGGRESLGNS